MHIAHPADRIPLDFPTEMPAVDQLSPLMQVSIGAPEAGLFCLIQLVLTNSSRRPTLCFGRRWGTRSNKLPSGKRSQREVTFRRLSA